MSNADQPPQRPTFDAHSPQHTPAARGWGLGIQAAMLAIGALICIRLGWGVFTAESKPVLPNPPQTSSPAATAPSGANDTSAPASHTDSLNARLTPLEDAAKLDLAKAQQREFLNQAENLQTELAQWQTELDKWNQEIALLLTSDAGKSLAATPAHVQSFRAIYELERSPQSRLDQIRELADQITRGTAAASKEPASALMPDPVALAQLKTFIDEARAADETYRSGRSQIVVLLRLAQRQGLSSEKSLREAVAEETEIQQLATIEKTRERFERAQKQADEQIAVAKEEAIRTAGEVEARKILDAAKLAHDRQLAEEELHKQEMAKGKRLASLQRDMPDIQKHLRPFITKGYAQPGNSDNIQAGDSIPVSLSKLTAFGALKAGREGMEKLMRCATVNNDRDHGSFPQYLGGDRGWEQTNKEFLKRAQQLLVDYGDLLVEKGLLSP